MNGSPKVGCTRANKVRVYVHTLLIEHHLKVAHAKLVKESIFSKKCALCSSLIHDVAEAKNKINMKIRKRAK